MHIPPVDAEVELQNLALPLVAREIRHQWHVGKLWMARKAHLIEHADTPFFDILQTAALEPGPSDVGAPVDLAALHREIDVAATGIPHDDAEFKTEQIPHDVSLLGRAARRAGSADDQFVVQEILVGFDRRGVPSDGHADDRVGAAEPGEPGRLEQALGLRSVDQRLEKDRASDDADHGSVPRRLRPQQIGQGHAARPGVILWDRRRLAGQVLADVTSDEPSVLVVGAAGAGADGHRHGLAGERRRRLRRGIVREQRD